MQEIWKFYKDTRRYRKDGTVWRGGYWEVSNFGNVKKDGVLYDCEIGSGGYLHFCGCVHRVVAELFIPNPENKPCVDHIDTNRLNNKVDNLRWVTYKENCNNPITKNRISESAKRRYYSEESREKQRQSILGRHKVWIDKEHNIYKYVK